MPVIERIANASRRPLNLRHPVFSSAGGALSHYSDILFRRLTLLVALSSLAILALMMIILTQRSYPALIKLGWDLIVGVRWDPVRDIYGLLPYVLGTLVTSGVALLVAVPISLGIAIFLSEMAPKYVRTPLSFVIELLAAIPSVIYGLWGIFIFRFWARDLIEAPLSQYLGFIPAFQGTPTGTDILTAGLILSIMIIPTISAVSREVMRAVPNSQREAAYSLGATKWETVRMGVLSYARSGILGASILGLGRAMGETMAVTMVIGGATGRQALPTSLFNPGQSLASLIANQFPEAIQGTLLFNTLIAAGLTLLIFSLIINVISVLLVRRVLKVKGGAIE